jgi:hypothetical protein
MPYTIAKGTNNRSERNREALGEEKTDTQKRGTKDETIRDRLAELLPRLHIFQLSSVH